MTVTGLRDNVTWFVGVAPEQRVTAWAQSEAAQNQRGGGPIRGWLVGR